MLSTLTSISSLFLSFSLLCLGHGLLNTLVGFRAVLENYSDMTIGLMGSAYFLGFVVGVYLCSRLLSNVGHIRTFAAIASLTSIIAISYILILSPLSWIIFRFAYGICIASLYMVLESWLNLLSTHSNRGKVLSIYMVLNYLNIALGQFFFNFFDANAFELFLIVSILISVSLIPLSISKKVRQVAITFEHLSFIRMIKTSPVASVGCFVSGLIAGTVWALCATYLAQNEFSANTVALLVAATFIGGLILQWPLGALSDKIDRRYVILGSCFVGSIVACMALIFLLQVNISFQAIIFGLLGAFIYPLYSLSNALMNDLLESKHLVKASGSLLQIHAIGAIIGPITTAALMEYIGAEGFFVALISFLSLACIAILGLIVVTPKRSPEKEKYVPIPRTSIGAFRLDPRSK